jgi:predicted ATPase
LFGNFPARKIFKPCHSNLDIMGGLRKYVITGASGSGKSTLIAELASRGYHAFDEVAASYIIAQQAKGIEEPWRSEDFQPALLKRQLALERRISCCRGIVFLDRGIPDTLGFFKYRKEEVPAGLAARVNKIQYDKVFFLESLGSFENPGFRVEKDGKEASRIAGIIKKEYEKLGYGLIDVPVLSVAKRADYVLGRIEKI